MKRTRRVITDEDRAAARALQKEGIKYGEIARRLGRSRHTISDLLGKPKDRVLPHTIEVVRVPPHVEDERNHRLALPLSLTALLLGDPPPGYSAFDRKMIEVKR